MEETTESVTDLRVPHLQHFGRKSFLTNELIDFTILEFNQYPTRLLHPVPDLHTSKRINRGHLNGCEGERNRKQGAFDTQSSRIPKLYTSDLPFGSKKYGHRDLKELFSNDPILG